MLISLIITIIMGKEKEIYSFLSKIQLDYAIGSVHFLGDSTVDMGPEFYNGKNIDKLFETYFEQVTAAAASGLFDIIAHCDTFTEAQERLNAIEQRLNECKLELNRSKTKIVHCQNSHKRQSPNQDVKRSFDFLGFTFKPRYVMFKGKIRVGFTPAMSCKSQKRINELCFKLKIQRMSHFNIYRS